MKALILALSLLSTQLYAANICKFETSYDFMEHAEKSEMIHSRTEATNKFSPVDRKMVFAMMVEYGKTWQTFKDEAAAMHDFLDFYEGEKTPGTNAGEIIRFREGTKTIALVHFWPGDNEFGAYFEVLSNGTFKKIATIGDGDIYCE